MAEALTYDSLVLDIQTYAERTDEPFVTQIPRFIMLAENRLAMEIKGLGFRRAVSFTMTQGSNTLEKPARWRETHSFSYVVNGDRVPIFLRSYGFCRSYWPDSSIQGAPAYYADFDYEHFLVVATPDANYSAELTYYERPEPLSDSVQTNWLTRYAPQLLLYATLLEAQPFLKLPERIQEFQMLYDRAATALANEEQGRRQ